MCSRSASEVVRMTTPLEAGIAVVSKIETLLHPACLEYNSEGQDFLV